MVEKLPPNNLFDGAASSNEKFQKVEGKGFSGKLIAVLLKAGYKKSETGEVKKRAGPLAAAARHVAARIIDSSMPQNTENIKELPEEIPQKISKEMVQTAQQAATQAVLRRALKLTSTPERELLAQKNQLTKIPFEKLDDAQYAEFMQIDAKLLHIENTPSSRETKTNLIEQKNQLIEKRKQLKAHLKKDPTSIWTKNLLVTNSKKLREIETKLSYMGTEEQKVQPTLLSAGRNLVERVPLEDAQSAIKKTLGSHEMQKAFQVEAIGALSESLPLANVVAARRKGGEVATTNIEGLVVGDEAIKQLMKNMSEVTQHTALAALTFQMWDLHTSNIGIDKSKDMVIFDTDLALFEDNDFVHLEGTLQPPLGHNRLQDMDMKVTDSVLDAHIEQVSRAISSQFVGRAHGFTQEEVGIIQQHLIDQFADVPALLVYQHEQFGPNEMFSTNSVDDVRKEFLKLIKAGTAEATAFFDALRERGIDDKKIEFLKKRPQLLHPGKMSIKQMATLIERKNHLQGFVELRKELQNLGDLNKDLILKNIDHLPISTSEKRELLKNLTGSDQTLIQEAIAKVQLLVSEDKIKWNTLALSMYPTMAAMHAAVKKHAGEQCVLADELAWSSKDFDTKVRDPLQEEILQRAEFLEELKSAK